MVDFLDDYLHTLRWLTDSAHHDAAVALITQATKQKPSLYASWAFTGQDYYRDPQALPNLEALQANVEMAHKLGFLRSDLDVSKYTDLSLAKEAAQRLQAEAAEVRDGHEPAFLL